MTKPENEAALIITIIIVVIFVNVVFVCGYSTSVFSLAVVVVFFVVVFVVIPSSIRIIRSMFAPANYAQHVLPTSESRYPS